MLVLPAASRRGLWHARRSGSARELVAAHFYIASRRIFNRRVFVTARSARRDLLRIKRLEPREPVGPPRTRALLRSVEPAFEVVAVRWAPGPMLVLLLVGRIDDAGDVPGSGQHKAHRSAEER